MERQSSRKPAPRFTVRRRLPGGPRPAGTDDRSAVELRLRRVHKASVVALAMLAEHKDPYASQHILRVSRLTDEMARVLQQESPYAGQIEDRYRERLRVASMLHDVGKVTIPDGILQKPGRLDPEERALMQKHSHNGRMILERAARLSEAGGYLALGAEIAGHHHEKFDGSGYPYRLGGTDIPLSARIVAVADVFDALTHRRSYKDAWAPVEAITYVRERAGTEFDPVVVEAFLSVIDTRNSVTIIAWNDGMSVGIEDLDNDHRTLIDLINQVAAADSRRDRINLEAVLDELIDYTVFHFDKEEKHMERAGYPELAGHRAIHTALTRQVLDIRRRVVAGHQAELGDEVLDFLSRWLREHILRSDALYRPYLVGNDP
ncbi:MAG TPA: bacteriohemerythrin [Azospirillum sp.]|nr:bacteriohemerythrin [Azospirillum sp.]